MAESIWFEMVRGDRHGLYVHADADLVEIIEQSKPLNVLADPWRGQWVINAVNPDGEASLAAINEHGSVTPINGLATEFHWQPCKFSVDGKDLLCLGRDEMAENFALAVVRFDTDGDVRLLCEQRLEENQVPQAPTFSEDAVGVFLKNSAHELSVFHEWDYRASDVQGLVARGYPPLNFVAEAGWSRSEDGQFIFALAELTALRRQQFVRLDSGGSTPTPVSTMVPRYDAACILPQPAQGYTADSTGVFALDLNSGEVLDSMGIEGVVILDLKADADGVWIQSTDGQSFRLGHWRRNSAQMYWFQERTERVKNWGSLALDLPHSDTELLNSEKLLGHNRLVPSPGEDGRSEATQTFTHSTATTVQRPTRSHTLVSQNGAHHPDLNADTETLGDVPIQPPQETQLFASLESVTGQTDHRYGLHSETQDDSSTVDGEGMDDQTLADDDLALGRDESAFTSGIDTDARQTVPNRVAELGTDDSEPAQSSNESVAEQSATEEGHLGASAEKNDVTANDQKLDQADAAEEEIVIGSQMNAAENTDEPTSTKSHNTTDGFSVMTPSTQRRVEESHARRGSDMPVSPRTPEPAAESGDKPPTITENFAGWLRSAVQSDEPENALRALKNYRSDENVLAECAEQLSRSLEGLRHDEDLVFEVIVSIAAVAELRAGSARPILEQMCSAARARLLDHATLPFVEEHFALAALRALEQPEGRFSLVVVYEEYESIIDTVTAEGLSEEQTEKIVKRTSTRYRRALEHVLFGKVKKKKPSEPAKDSSSQSSAETRPTRPPESEAPVPRETMPMGSISQQAYRFKPLAQKFPSNASPWQPTGAAVTDRASSNILRLDDFGAAGDEMFQASSSEMRVEKWVKPTLLAMSSLGGFLSFLVLFLGFELGAILIFGGLLLCGGSLSAIGKEPKHRLWSIMMLSFGSLALVVSPIKAELHQSMSPWIFWGTSVVYVAFIGLLLNGEVKTHFARGRTLDLEID